MGSHEGTKPRKGRGRSRVEKTGVSHRGTGTQRGSVVATAVLCRFGAGPRITQIHANRKKGPLGEAPLPFFYSRGFPKTAEDCHFYNGFFSWLRGFVASWLRVSPWLTRISVRRGRILGDSQNPLLRVPAPLREDLGCGRRRVRA
jgi:hypothetical protein